MQRKLIVLGLPFLLVSGMLLFWQHTLPIVQAESYALPPLTQFEPQEPVTCTTHTTGMTLTASSTIVNVGDMLTVVATLANEGCSLVGLPSYRVQLDPPAPAVLTALSPTSQTHMVGLDHGETDVATFTLRVTGNGTAIVQASASFEVHLGYPGPAYWAADVTPPLTMTVAPTDTEIVVLQQAAAALGCPTADVQHADSVYTFGCAVAAGHSIDARIERFNDEASAEAAFAEGQGTLVLEPFRCYPAYQWIEEQEIMPQHQMWQRWVAARWLITTHNVDDTGIPVAPSPVKISEAVYRAAIRNRLFPACDRLYLPVIVRP